GRSPTPASDASLRWPRSTPARAASPRLRPAPARRAAIRRASPTSAPFCPRSRGRTWAASRATRPPRSRTPCSDGYAGTSGSPGCPGAKDGLRQPRQLEEEHVPAARELTAVRPQVLREDRRVRTVEHDEPPRRLRVVHREGPRDGTPPVVSDDRRFPLAEGLDQPAHVGDQLGQRVGRDPLGLVALVVAAQVRRDDAKPWRERRDLVTPRI